MKPDLVFQIEMFLRLSLLADEVKPKGKRMGASMFKLGQKCLNGLDQQRRENAKKKGGKR